MKAEVVSVGTELLMGQTVDSNAATAGRLLADIGIDHLHRQTVGDNLPRLTKALQLALGRADIVLTIGGLGPTQDDLTRDGVAAALNSPLVEDPQLKKQLEALMRLRKRTISPNQYRQALRPECAAPVDNPNGTAPGLIATKDNKTVICLPGPPNEFNPMLNGPVKDHLLSLGDGSILVSRVLRIIGIGEASLEEEIKDLLNHPQVTVAPYAKTGEVHLRLTTRATSNQEGQAKIAPVAEEIYNRTRNHIYAEGEDSLEAWIIKTLTERQQTVAVAESCTGGLLGGALTSVEGASNAFAGGFQTYTAQTKQSLLGVSDEAIHQPEHGTVSERCAQEMAEGAKTNLKTDFAVSITGIAGAAHFEENGVTKPNGLVYIGLASPNGTTVKKHQFGGSRDTIRQRAVAWALADLRLSLIDNAT